MTDTIRMWAEVWKWILYVGAGAFLALMVFVIIKGIFDVRSLFASLNKPREADPHNRK